MGEFGAFSLWGHDLFDWSNWVFGFGALAFVVFAECREFRRKRQIRNLTFELAPVQAGAASEDQLRSLLIQAGVANQPFSLAVARAGRLGVGRQAVETAAMDLRRSQLLSFRDPLKDSTKLSLS